MKKLIISLLAMVGLNVMAQTNKIVFPVLLSSSNTVLMTNAEFRCTSGTRLFFKYNERYESFEATNLDANILAKIGLTVDGLRAAAIRKQKNDSAFRQEQAADQIRDIKIKMEQIQQEQQEKAKAQRIAASRPKGSTTISHTYISGGDAISGYEYGTTSTTIPND